MTVRELIEKLEELPQDLPVVMSSDSEGNGYSPLSLIHQVWYVAESTWNGEVYTDEDLEELKADGMAGDAKKSVCFWPVN